MPTPETIAEVEAGRAVLGCAVEPGLPVMKCSACGHSWGRLQFSSPGPATSVFDEHRPGAGLPDGHCLRGRAAELTGVDAEALKRWHRLSLAGDSRFDAVSPSAAKQFGSLKVWLYAESDLKAIIHFEEPEEAASMSDEKPVVLEGWRYEWDHTSEKYVTTDYITTDESFSYAVTRIGWLGRSRSGYKVWNTRTGLTEGVFPTWGEARLTAIELATRASTPLLSRAMATDAEAIPERAADEVARATPPTTDES
jgi:hypothetical protein